MFKEEEQRHKAARAERMREATEIKRPKIEEIE